MSVMTLPRPRLAHQLRCSGLAFGLAVLPWLAHALSDLRGGDSAEASGRVPQSAALEAAAGVRFSRVAAIGDGGLVMVEYVVLDVEKAAAFQADQAHLPTLTSESGHASTNHVSIMKPGHQIRTGQTYYFVYENTGSALRPGEMVSLRYLSHDLRHVPVL